MNKYITAFFITLFTSLLSFSILANSSAIPNLSYINSAYLLKVPFGSHSHWIQPWRAYMETVPAKTFLDGIGIVWNVHNSEDPELIAEMLAKHGFKRVRMGIEWGAIDYDDETKIAKRHASRLEKTLQALKKFNLRPLILLNAHHGAPCPLKNVQQTLILNASAGDTEIELDSIDDLQVGYSGISKIDNGVAAEYLITNIKGHTITLSKPLPKDLIAGSILNITTLKYRPFSIPNTVDYQNTIAGWNKYVDTVTKFATETLGTTNSKDKGFDLEIWNELTFGSNFLDINEYYANEPYQYNHRDIWTNLVKETAAYIDANSTKFTGVEIGNGFSNTIPWPASSQQPARINAIGKHPYPPRKNYPQDEYKGKRLNALAQEDFYIPTYSAWFPEYYSTALQTETIIRDSAPITNEFYGTERGRYARIIKGKVAPVPMWITEVNIAPEKDNPDISSEKALALKAKSTARFFCFYLNKGITKLDLYGVAGGNTGWGIIKDNFLDYAQQENSGYPSNDREYVSPALQVVNRITSKMREGLDTELEKTQGLTIVSIKDKHDNYQFKGDGTKARPNLYDRDVFTFLPFQVNSNKLVIPYYVMTRDIQQDLTPEKFIVEIGGIGNIKSIEAYDPIADQKISVKQLKAKKNNVVLELTATDYPYLLTINGEFASN